MNETIGREEAGALAARASGFWPGRRWASIPPAEEAYAAIAHLGAVQIDTISVVERAHHHVVWSRSPHYRPETLPALEAEPRRIFEYWSHAAAYLPLSDWRYCLPRMERTRRLGHPWFKVDEKTVELVRERIRSEGPLSAGHWEDDGDAKPRDGWWDWKPSKVALDYLFHAGEIMPLKREGFSKLFDLTERVLPPETDRRPPSESELASWHVDRATRTLGVFARGEVAYMRKEGLEGIDDELARRVEEGGLLRVKAPADEDGGVGRRELFADSAALSGVAPATAAEAWILSPFDPLVIDRRRLARLFGFEYTLECYLPAARRRFGYFGLPVLVAERGGGPRFDGLLDAKLERSEACLRVQRLRLARPKPARGLGAAAADRREEYLDALAAAIAFYAAWQGAERVEFDKVETSDPVVGRRLPVAVGRLMRGIGPRPAP